MRIPTTKLPLPAQLLQPRAKTQLLDNLRAGQIVKATALSENRNGNIKLQIGVVELTAQTTLSVRPGQSLLLQVKSMGSPPELKLLTPPSQKQLQANALKLVLPRQQPLSRLFEKLAESDTPSIEKSIPAAVRNEIRALLNRLPSAENPDFKQQVKEMLLQSGIFAEALLIHGKPSGNNLKTNLLRLLTLIQPLLPQEELFKGQTNAPQRASNDTADDLLGLKFLADLNKQLDGALARIQLNQLSSLPQEEPEHQIWQLELPIRQGDQIDLFQIRVKRERSSSDDDASAPWELVLRMNFAPLGPMRVQLKLQSNVISTLVWSEYSRTTELVTDNLPTLQTAFERVGLEVKKIAAFTAEVEEDIRLPDDISLLSELA